MLATHNHLSLSLSLPSFFLFCLLLTLLCVSGKLQFVSVLHREKGNTCTLLNILPFYNTEAYANSSFPNQNYQLV